MTENQGLILIGIAALVASLLLTAWVKALAIKRGFVDQPGQRKIHAQPIALGGGIAIFWIIMTPLLAAWLLGWYCLLGGVPSFLPEPILNHLDGLISHLRQLTIFMLSIGAMHMLGLVDDRQALGPRIKLIAQLAIASLLAVGADIRFSFFIDNTLITTILSVLWMVAILNAFNFLDNMDGLSAGIAAICSAVLLTAAWQSGQVFVSAILLLLIGALVGFLYYNFNPAKIFMGDSGSLVVGLIVAAMTIRTTYYHEAHTGGNWYSALMPLIALAVPLYDFTGVVIIRLMQGRSPFVGDKQHFSHRLVEKGMTQRQAVLTIWLATACTGLGATFMGYLPGWGALLVAAQTVMILFIIAILEQPIDFAKRNQHQ